jgi:hypothetical protein
MRVPKWAWVLLILVVVWYVFFNREGANDPSIKKTKKTKTKKD